jgi:hypothetical protein
MICAENVRSSNATAPDGSGFGDVLPDTFIGRGRSVEREIERSLRVSAAFEHAETMNEDEGRPGELYPAGSLGGLDLFFADGVRLEIHVVAGLIENGGEVIENREAGAAIEHFHDPVNIAEVAPLGIEIKAAIFESFAAEKNGAGEIGEAHPDVIFARQQGFAMAEIVALRVRDDSISKDRLHGRVLLKEIVDGLERAGQVLLVAIKISDDVALSALETAIDGVVHTLVLFDERFDARVLREPVAGVVIGAGILDDVLEGDTLLVGNGGDAELEPVGVSEAGGDD